LDDQIRKQAFDYWRFPGALETRRFVFDGAALIPPVQLESATAAFTGKDRTFADI